MDLPPLPGDPSLASIGNGRLRLSPAARALVEPLRGEEVEAAWSQGRKASRPKRVANPEAANRRRRGKAEEALLEALRRLQARGKRCLRHPPFQGLLGALQAAVGGLTGEGQTPDPGLGSQATPAAYLSTPGRPPSPCSSLRGLCGDSRRSTATLCGPPPAPGPGRASLCAKVNFREGGPP
jgi:hypothetical protein